MSITNELDEFYATKTIVIIRDELKFHHKLGIGEQAYKWLRARENLTTFSEAMGVGGMASAAMASSVVAGSLFSSSGILATIGLATAATPIGWVIGVGALAGGGYIGLSKLLERSKENGLVIIPKYINTPLDIIGASVIDLLLPIGLKFASLDGKICEKESDVITNHFINDWGYADAYVYDCLAKTNLVLDKVSITDLIEKLIDFAERNPDCELISIQNTLTNFLQKVVEADGVIDENELNHLALVQGIFENSSKKSILHEKLKIAKVKFGETATSTKDVVFEATKQVGGVSASAKDVTLKSAKKIGEESSKLGKSAVSGLAEKKKLVLDGISQSVRKIGNKTINSESDK